MYTNSRYIHKDKCEHSTHRKEKEKVLKMHQTMEAHFCMVFRLLFGDSDSSVGESKHMKLRMMVRGVQLSMQY